jgi:hypothetical protein
LFVTVYRCNDISRGKTIVELFWNLPKISPVCIQYDTTDANLELIVYSYIFRCCVYPLFLFFIFFTEAIASVASMDATPLDDIGFSG